MNPEYTNLLLSHYNQEIQDAVDLWIDNNYVTNMFSVYTPLQKDEIKTTDFMQQPGIPVLYANLGCFMGNPTKFNKHHVSEYEYLPPVIMAISEDGRSLIKHLFSVENQSNPWIDTLSIKTFTRTGDTAATSLDAQSKNYSPLCEYVLMEVSGAAFREMIDGHGNVVHILILNARAITFNYRNDLSLWGGPVTNTAFIVGVSGDQKKEPLKPFGFGARGK